MKSERKITPAQLSAVEKKLIVLQLRQQRITKQLTPLKITVRKYIQQNMAALEAHVTPPRVEHNTLRWAMDKVERGYFGIDTNLGNLRDTVAALKDAGL